MTTIDKWAAQSRPDNEAMEQYVQEEKTNVETQPLPGYSPLSSVIPFSVAFYLTDLSLSPQIKRCFSLC